MTLQNKRLGLALSGGGYRAAAFHLGTLNKLQEMGLLEQVDVLSTISGGSITGAYYSLNSADYEAFKQQLYDKLHTGNIITRVLLSSTFLRLILFFLLFMLPAVYFLFTQYAWLFPLLLILFIFLLFRFQFIIFPVSNRIEKLYDEFFFDKKPLGLLGERPLLVMGSTNLQTARAFTFSRDWMQDSTYQYMAPRITFTSNDFPIARAVMASSCVPFAFTPISIDACFFNVQEDAKRVHPVLVDGGVYDNQGIHRIIQSGQYACDSVIVSDAGGVASGELTFKNTISLLLATVEVFMDRIKKAQMVKDVYENAGGANREIAYFSLGWDSENCIKGFIDNLVHQQISQGVILAHALLPEWVAEPDQYRASIMEHLKMRTRYDAIIRPDVLEKTIARKVSTNLTALSKQQLDALIKQAAALTEIQVRLYCPTLLNP